MSNIPDEDSILTKLQIENRTLTQQVEWLTKSLQRLQQQVDAAHRHIGLPPILDDQVISINSRLGRNGGDAA